MKWVTGLLIFLCSYALAGNRALIYYGPGACDEQCSSQAYNMATRGNLSPSYIGPTDIDSKTTKEEVDSIFKDVSVWIQPGGVALTVLQSMSSEMISALRGFVVTGGGYVGFCAGAFTSTAMVGQSGSPGFNIMPGQTTVYDSPTDAAIVKIKWEGKDRYVYWEGGPYITGVPDSSVIATYPNGEIAAARANYGKGKVFISGFHPEAPQSWRTYYGLRDPDGLDYSIADEMIQWVQTKDQ